MKTQPLSAVPGYAIVIVAIVGIVATLLPLSAEVEALGQTPTPEGGKGIQKSNDQIMTEQAKVTPSPGGRVHPAPGTGPNKQPNPDSPSASSSGDSAATSGLMTALVIVTIIGVAIYLNFFRSSDPTAK